MRDYTLYAIIFTIIFTIIFPIIAIIFTIIAIFFRLFPFISWCRHPENGIVLTAILDLIMKEWLVSADEECLLICGDWKARRQNENLTGGEFWYYYTYYFYDYTHYLS